MSKEKTYYFILILLIINVKLSSDGWINSYGSEYSEYGRSVIQNSDEDYIVVGLIISMGITYDGMYILKTDTNGDSLWTKIYSSLADALVGNSITSTNNNNFVITGKKFTRLYMMKINSFGDSLWAKLYGGSNMDEGHSVKQTSDNGFIVVGWTRSFGGCNAGNVWLLKTDEFGDTLWTRTFGGTNYSVGYSVDITSDGSYILTGKTGNYNFDIYLIKTDSLGNEIWSKTYGDTSDHIGYAVEQTTDGGYIIIGTLLIKTDSMGDTIWTKPISGRSGQQTTDGGYIIVGETGTYPDWDVYMVKTDSLGNILWTRTIGGDNTDTGASVQQTEDNGYIITGYTSSFGNGERDILLIKTDSAGNTGSVNVSEEEQEFFIVGTFFSISNENNIKIKFFLQEADNINFNIYDISGRLISSPVSGYFMAGYHEFSIDIDEKQGIYFYRFLSEHLNQKGKFILF